MHGRHRVPADEGERQSITGIPDSRIRMTAHQVYRTHDAKVNRETQSEHHFRLIGESVDTRRRLNARRTASVRPDGTVRIHRHSRGEDDADKDEFLCDMSAVFWNLNLTGGRRHRVVRQH